MLIDRPLTQLSLWLSYCIFTPSLILCNFRDIFYFLLWHKHLLYFNNTQQSHRALLNTYRLNKLLKINSSRQEKFNLTLHRKKSKNVGTTNHWLRLYSMNDYDDVYKNYFLVLSDAQETHVKIGKTFLFFSLSLSIFVVFVLVSVLFVSLCLFWTGVRWMLCTCSKGCAVTTCVRMRKAGHCTVVQGSRTFKKVLKKGGLNEWFFSVYRSKLVMVLVCTIE